MGRVAEPLLLRIEQFSDRILAVASVLSDHRVSDRIINQIIGSGTSAGANLFEADECTTRPEFCKCLSIVIRELSETRYWIRLIGRNGLIPSDRLLLLEQECLELQRVFGAMLTRTRKNKPK